MDKDHKNIKIQAGLFIIVATLSFIAAFLTLIPYDAAGKANIIGYKSLCTFTPVSTIVCLLASRTFYTLWKRKTGREPYPEKNS